MRGCIAVLKIIEVALFRTLCLDAYVTGSVLGEQIGEQILPWGSLCEHTPLGDVFGEFSSS